MFLGQNASGIEDFFADINIPFDCEFFVAHQELGCGVALTEVYRVSAELPLQTNRLGDSGHNKLYERRNSLQGLIFRSAVMESVSVHCQVHPEHYTAHIIVSHPEHYTAHLTM
jgi:hypothetical protein